MTRPNTDVVLVHGWGFHGGVWSDLIGGLPEHRCHAPNLPGHGGRPWRGERGIEAWARAALADAPDRAVWIGWSLGASVALQVAARHPERVAGLVLMNATPRFVTTAGWPHGVAPETLDGFQQGLVTGPEAVLRRFAALQVQGEPDAAALRRRLLALGAAPGWPAVEALAAGLDVLETADLRDALPALAVPTLWLSGARDRVTPAAAARAAAGCTPRAELAVLAGAAHAPWLSRPDDCLQRIKAFLHDG